MTNGWKLTPDERFREGLCDVYLMKFQKHRNIQGPVEQQWEYLQSALEWNPKNRLIYEGLSQLCADARVRAIAPMVRSKIDSLLDATEFSSELLFANSNLLLVDKQFGSAIETLRQIVQKDQEFHPAMNNLAWLLIDQTTVSPEHLEQAQRIAKRAVELLPSSASYRDTLGSVLFKQRRWTEAIAEFEVSLRSSQNSLPTLEKIAQAYQELGQIELSDQYRSRIEQLRSVGGSAKPK
jgi:tetratricopeptide (TPR) repeat protein